jgi:hypothetical protein
MDDSHYIHGTSPEEQECLSLLNDLLNAASLRAMRLRQGDRVLDPGSDGEIDERTIVFPKAK